MTKTTFKVGDIIISKKGTKPGEITNLEPWQARWHYEVKYIHNGRIGYIAIENAILYHGDSTGSQNAEQIESLENIWTDKHGIQSSKITHTNYNWAPDELEEFYDVDSLRDPFHYDDNPIFNGTKTGFSLHPLTDFVNDYVTENFHDTDALDNLKAELSSLIATIDLVIQS